MQKQEVDRQAINSVLVDGQHYPYRFQNGDLSLSLPVPGGDSRCVAIQYKNDLELASVGVSKDSLVDYLLRMASDFRDIYLSKNVVGRAVIRLHDEFEEKPTQVLACVLVFMGVCMFAGYRWLLLVRRRHHPLNKASKCSVTDRTAGEHLEPAAERNKRFDPLKGKGS